MELTPALLLSAYSQGVFPMDDEGTVYWYDPNPRAVIPLDERFHVPHSLARTIRKGRFEVRVDTAFAETMRQAVMDAKIRHQYSPISDYVTITLGIASFVPEGDLSVDDFVKKADDALYEAKRKGRNKAAVALDGENV